MQIKLNPDDMVELVNEDNNVGVSVRLTKEGTLIIEAVLFDDIAGTKFTLETWEDTKTPAAMIKFKRNP